MTIKLKKQLSLKHPSFGFKPSRPMLLPLLIGAAITTMTIGSANAQTDAQRIADLESKLQRALTVIDKLSDKVEHLENAKSAVPAKIENKNQVVETANSTIPETELTKTIAEQNTRIETMQQQVSQMTTASSSRALPMDWLHGFADVGGGYSSNGHPKGFGVGSIDFYITPKLGGQVRSLAELLFEYDRLGGLGTDLERMQIGYAFSDQATVWLGRFHTPYGYWHNAYHHGQQIQPSLLRARFIDFEDKGGILPAHTTGLWGNGSIATAGGKFTYDIYAGNTPRIVNNNNIGGGNLEPNVAGFTNPSLTAGGKLGYIFNTGLLEGLNVGVHGLRSQVNITTNAIPSTQVEMSMAGGYLYYNNYDWEVIGELYGFMNHDKITGTGAHNSWAGFVHVGRSFDRWTPYGRLEKAELSKTDPYFNSLAYGYSYSREALGMRYDVNPQTALKMEFDYTQPEPNLFTGSLNNFWESRLQYAIRW